MSIGNSPEDDRPSDDLRATTPPAVEQATGPSDALPSIGHVLRQARVDAGLTVDEISTSTRVRIPIVQAIEEDDFSRCGGDVYARGHIRTIARAVGVDPEPLLARYADAHGGRPAPTPATPLFEAERIRSEPRRPNWTAAMVAAIVAVIGFVGYTAFGGSGADAAKQQAADGASPATGKPKPSATHKPTRPTDPKADPTDSAIAAAPRDKVTVKINAADGRSWISAKDHNGRIMFDGLLEQGQSKTFQDNQKVDLVLGDAGAIQLYVNGKQVSNEFQPGQVERLTYTKGDPEVG